MVPPPGKSFNFQLDKSFDYHKWSVDFQKSIDFYNEAHQELYSPLIATACNGADLSLLSVDALSEEPVVPEETLAVPSSVPIKLLPSEEDATASTDTSESGPKAPVIKTVPPSARPADPATSSPSRPLLSEMPRKPSAPRLEVRISCCFITFGHVELTTFAFRFLGRTAATSSWTVAAN